MQGLHQPSPGAGRWSGQEYQGQQFRELSNLPVTLQLLCPGSATALLE